MKLIVKLIVLILSLTFVHGQAFPDSLWVRGTQAVAIENYGLAVDSFERILSQGYEHESLYYNLGNSYYRLEKLGLAIWAYEKGLQFKPGYTDLEFNLDVAKARIKDRIEIPRGFFLLDFYRAFKYSQTMRSLMLWASLLLLMAGAGYFANKSFWQGSKILNSSIMVFVIVSILLHLISLDKFLELSDKQEGIIIKKVTEAHSTPSGLGKTVFRVHEGLKVEITQDQSDWLEIILLDGKKGWVYSGAVRVL